MATRNIQKTHRVLIKGLRGILKTDGPIMFTVKGHSMEPTLRNGDMIGISWVDHDYVQVGDIVLAILMAAILTDGRDIQMLVHRVVEIRQCPESVEGEQDPSRLVILKGDSTEQPDPPIPLEWIVGRLEQEPPDKTCTEPCPEPKPAPPRSPPRSVGKCSEPRPRGGFAARLRRGRPRRRGLGAFSTIPRELLSPFPPKLGGQGGGSVEVSKGT